MLRSTLEGVTLTIQCALPLMRESGWGRIVNISSDATNGWPGLGPYATAKAGLHGLTRTLAVELGSVNILSNIVMPGFVLTERNQQNVPSQYQEHVKQHTPTYHAGGRCRGDCFSRITGQPADYWGNHPSERRTVIQEKQCSQGY